MVGSSKPTAPPIAMRVVIVFTFYQEYGDIYPYSTNENPLSGKYCFHPL